jgi:prephenate dehydrogenase
MTIQITIIGLGQIGTSIGLCLAGNKEFVRVGHDLELKISRQAQKLGALDRADYNLPNSVQNADLVILSIPADQVRETIEFITQDLRPGAVVMDTAPAKVMTAGWARQYLPPDRYYVGLLPALNPKYFLEHGSGQEIAHADLFQNSLMAICAPPEASAQAVEATVNLVQLLGADPYFVDPYEIDGLLAATHMLPQLLATAMASASMGQPGWDDRQKIAGRAFAQVCALVAELDMPQSLVASALLNRENTSRLLDQAIDVLYQLKQEIAAGNETALLKTAQASFENYNLWHHQRNMGDWSAVNNPLPELPTASESIGSLFGIRRKKKKE